MNNMNFCSWTSSFHGLQSSHTTQLCWKKDYKGYFTQRQSAADWCGAAQFPIDSGFGKAMLQQSLLQNFDIPGNQDLQAEDAFSSTSVIGADSGIGKMTKQTHKYPLKKSSASQAAEPRPQHRAEQRGFMRAFDGKSFLKLFLLEHLSCFLTKRQIFHGSIWVFLCF